MIIKLTNSEAKKIIEAHFRDFMKLTGQRVDSVSGNYSGFEISCIDLAEAEEEIIQAPEPRPDTL